MTCVPADAYAIPSLILGLLVLLLTILHIVITRIKYTAFRTRFPRRPVTGYDQQAMAEDREELGGIVCAFLVFIWIGMGLVIVLALTACTGAPLNGTSANGIMMIIGLVLSTVSVAVATGVGCIAAS